MQGVLIEVHDSVQMHGHAHDAIATHSDGGHVCRIIPFGKERRPRGCLKADVVVLGDFQNPYICEKRGRLDNDLQGLDKSRLVLRTVAT